MIRRARPSQGAAVALVAVAVLVAGSLALLAVDVLGQPLSRRTLITGVVLLILLPAVLLGQYAPPPYRLPYRWRWRLLGVQALLTYLPVLLFEYAWLSLLGFLAGAVLLTVPRPVSVVIALAVVASGPALVHSSLASTHRSGMSVLVSTVVTGSAVYAVVHLALLAARLQASQTQAARLAEYRERARIAQDLHDLFGSSRVSIAVQSEGALRHTEPATPAHEALSEIARLARQAHHEVRGLTSAHAPAQLHAELAHARRLLSGAGVATTTTLPPRLKLPAAVSGCVGAVLREAVSNVLQHSRATRCDIVLTARPSRVRLSVRNDGAPPRAAPGPHAGSGLAGLRFRALVLGGTVETACADGRFALTVELPLDPAVPLGDADRVHHGAGV
ncbi:sensor histidine kinase [Streptomyces flavalbus]|uniref:Sensor histidine kinase n=1 Tax=Streptomyces flavalbus TaxID=2665155 RepID=A0ABW2W670_9ACTN